MSGRFLQTEPLRYGDGPNIYAYVHGDPVNHGDRTGTADDDDDDWAYEQEDGSGGGRKPSNNWVEEIVVERERPDPYLAPTPPQIQADPKFLTNTPTVEYGPGGGGGAASTSKPEEDYNLRRRGTRLEG